MKKETYEKLYCDEKICVVCSGTFYRRKSKGKGRPIHVIRPMYSRTCSPKCSRKRLDALRKIYLKKYRERLKRVKEL